MIVEEVLPHALAGLNVTDDPMGRAIGGNSSGGCGAFNIAWEYPSQFGLVLTHNGSFVNIKKPGAGTFPKQIRDSEQKPLRVFLQSGAGDLNNQHGSWPKGNDAMYEALNEKGYDVRYMFGTSNKSGHGPGGGGASYFPETLLWAFRGWPITH